MFIYIRISIYYNVIIVFFFIGFTCFFIKHDAIFDEAPFL